MTRFLGGCLLLLVSGPALAAELTVSIRKLDEDRGVVVLYLFPKSAKAAFPLEPGDGKAVCIGRAAIRERAAVIRCEHVAPGEYAVFAFHDENGNSKVDHHWYGPPAERIGFSNQARPSAFGPPDFEEAAFEVGDRDLALEVSLEDF